MMIQNDETVILYDVERVGENTLYSPSFTDNRYFVHLSPNRNYLVIRPSEKGRAVCINNRIELERFGDVKPFTGKEKLNAEYSRRYGGMLVYL